MKIADIKDVLVEQSKTILKYDCIIFKIRIALIFIKIKEYMAEIQEKSLGKTW